MDRLRTLEIFKAVAERGSFSKGAESVGVSCSVATRAVQDLEESLGARLLQRSPRRIALTVVGQEVLQRAADLLDHYRDIEAVSSLTARDPSGVVRVVAPASYASALLSTSLAEFRSLNPKIAVELRAADDDAETIDDEADVALCVGHPIRPTLIARHVGATSLRLYASPSYIARHGMPVHPSDLPQHECLTWSGARRGQGWSLRHVASGVPYQVDIDSAAHSNSLQVIVSAALHGAGIALLPHVIAQDLMRQQRLAPLMHAWQAEPLDVCLAYSSRRHQPLRVRRLVDHLRESLAAELNSSPRIAEVSSRAAEPTEA